MSQSRSESGWVRLVKGTGMSLALRLSGAGLGFMFNLLLARKAGAEGAGLFFLSLSVTGLTALAVRLGLDAVVVRQTAAHMTAGRWPEVLSTARTAVQVTAATSTCAAVALFFLAPGLAGTLFHKPALAPLLQALALSIVPAALNMIFAELLRGAQQLGRSQCVQVVVSGAVGLPLLALFGGALGVQAAVLAQLVGSVAACALGAWWWWSLLRSRAPGVVSSPAATAALLRSSMPLFWFSLLNALMGTLDVLLLGSLGTAADVGVYGIAVRLAMLTSFILLAVNSYAGPQFAAFNERKDIDGLVRLAIASTRLTMAAAAPLLLVFAFAPTWLLGLFGREFAESGIVLAVLAMGQFVNVATGSVGQILIMTGHERDMRNASFASAALTVSLHVVLIPRFGAVGAAVATAAGVMALNLIASAMVRRRVGVFVHFFASRKGR